MAVRQARLFNSTAPFCGSPKADLKGSSYPPCSAADQGTDEEDEEAKEAKESKIEYFPLTQFMSKAWTEGTAAQVAVMSQQNKTIIAQAECKYNFSLKLIKHVKYLCLDIM